MKPFAIDIDDVLVDFSRVLFESLLKRYPNVTPNSDWHNFDVCERFGIDRQDFFDHIIEDGLIEICQPFSQVRKAMQQLERCGADLVLITSRGYHPDAYALTKASMNKHEIPFHDLIIVPTGKTKAQAAYSRYPKGFQFMLDDLPENLDGMIEGGMTKQAVLIDQPWNRHRAEFRDGSSRFNSVAAFVQHLKEMYKRPPVIEDSRLAMS